MKNYLALVILVTTAALAQPMIPITNISPITGPSIIGRESGTGRAQQITVGSGLEILNGIIVATGGGGGGAPTNATYITQTPNATLTNEQPLSLLATGLLKSTTGTGVITIATSGTDYLPITGGTGITTVGTVTTGTWGATTIAVNKGGTGQTTYTNGQILIGNTTSGGLDKTTITAGGNITITNAPGSITIAASGAGTGNVTGSSLTANVVLVGNGTNSIGAIASIGNAGAALRSAGAGAPPAFGALNLAGGSNIITGALPAINGGTGLSSGTSGGVPYFSTTTTIGSSALLVTNNIVVGGGAGTAPFTTNVSIAGGNDVSIPGNLTVTGNQTVGNFTTATLNVTDNITSSGTTDGMLWIGSTSSGNFTKATLTAGDGITITNGANAITINATVSGTVTVANGGTGQTSLTDNNIIIGNTTGAVKFLAPGSSGNVVTSNGTAFASTAPTWFGNAIVSGCTTVSANSTGNVTLVAGGNMTITTDNTAKTITFAAAGGGGSITMNATLAVDDTEDAIKLSGVLAGTTIAQWEAVSINSSSVYILANATNTTSTGPAFGLAVAAYVNTNPAIVVREGPVRNDAWNWTPGAPIYVSATGGALTQTAPSTSANMIQRVGTAITADKAYFHFGSGEYLTVP